MEIFDKEDVYDDQISPLMREIINICNEHGIPMIASFTYEVCEDRGPCRCTTLINNIEGRNDKAYREAHKLIVNGGHQTFAITVSKQPVTDEG